MNSRTHKRCFSDENTKLGLFSTLSPNKLLHSAMKLEHLIADDLLSIGFGKESIFFQKRERSLAAPAYTILALESLATVVIGRTARSDRHLNAEVIHSDGCSLQLKIDCPFDFIDRINKEYSQVIDYSAVPLEIGFAAGLIGYLGFGITSSIENIRRNSVDPLSIPDAVLTIPESIIYIDHTHNLVNVISHSADQLNNLQSQLQQLNITPKTTSFYSPQLLSAREIFESAQLTCAMPKQQFLKRAEEARAFIKEGQCFQIVLSQRFYAATNRSAKELFSSLLKTAPSSYNYLINLPDFQYLGASPETMISAKSERVRLCALAGTRARGISIEQDARHEEELKNNEKELAEHLMLVDLGRNDLGKVCRPGTIEVGPIAQVLKYPNVMHLGTEIFGRLESHETHLSALKACFPRGTVSGAPKVRALELLSDLEQEQRGIYSGSVGFFDCRGNMDTAIAIRSALIKDGIAHVNAGAGIVFDSSPEHEYLETIHKASSIAGILKLFDEVKAS
ncbi:MAG: anthranilate synthase component I family protein [Candidatus Obscuribacterales bacterium]|nr:anthranilate synthase component I family protein [Candidatus Obscuribacterales bacterium]